MADFSGLKLPSSVNIDRLSVGKRENNGWKLNNEAEPLRIYWEHRVCQEVNVFAESF